MGIHYLDDESQPAAGTSAGSASENSHDEDGDDSDADRHPAHETIQPSPSIDAHTGESSQSVSPVWLSKEEEDSPEFTYRGRRKLGLEAKGSSSPERWLPDGLCKEEEEGFAGKNFARRDRRKELQVAGKRAVGILGMAIGNTAEEGLRVAMEIGEGEM
ncbi:aromatic ring-hydroxylating dioxygenase [Striga asiatica]|uniref:Aromatic ring-hydroxylating dioxygenase n=1 Tax=Striga asiatica TaxID=4170 RepID=A0A5A7RET5_STRAF|nr:aromatic ring-hydroxylating dioxygenase [Striga asiatica]